MSNSRKWAVLAIAHLIVVTGLTAGVTVIAFRLGQSAKPLNNSAALLASNPPSDAEIARLNLLSTRIDVLQSNLANADTVAYKRQRIVIEENVVPRISETQLDMTQGSIEQTGGSTDLAIQGEGFFHIKVRPNMADGTAYTRNGVLQRNRNGDLIVAIGEGFELIPPINIPSSGTNITIDQDGTVRYTAQPGRTTTAGQICLCRFVNAPALSRTDGLFTETAQSGEAIISNPGDSGTGVVLQGYLEESNVDPLKEWAYLRRAQNMLQYSSQPSNLIENKRPQGRNEPKQIASGHAMD